MTLIIQSGATETNVINVLYSSVFETGVLTGSNETEGYVAANVIDDATWNGWRPSEVPANVRTDCTVDVICDMAGIAAHDMATSGAGFRVQYSADTFTWTTVSDTVYPLTNDDIFVCFPQASARYWRVEIVGAICTVGVIKLGKKLAFPCAPIEGHKPLHHARKVEMLSNKSMGGNFLGNRPVSIGAETSVNIGMVDRDWAENDLAAFEWHYNTGRAFFYCGSPSDTAKDRGYCRREGGMNEMSVTWVEGDLMADVSFELASHVAA